MLIFFCFLNLILFPLQNVINRNRNGINRMPAYIAVYLEDDNCWENRLSDNMAVFRAHKKKIMENIRLWNFLIGRTNATQLGLFGTIFFLVMYFSGVNLKAVTFIDYSLIYLSIALSILLFMSNKKELSNMSSRGLYISRLGQDKDLRELKRKSGKNNKVK